jgi:gamma-glutamyltranspeptidase / glutathione hydrolase
VTAPIPPTLAESSYPSRRPPVLADNMVCTTQPLAAQAGLWALRQGGNAVDAALATAIALTVVEPTMNGIGSDAYAIVWDGTRLHGLNSSGRAPAALHRARFDGHAKIPPRGWDVATVPGAVAAWRALSDRFGGLPFARLFEPAVAYARQGYLVSPSVARQWASAVESLRSLPGFADCFLPNGRAPALGERFRSEAHATTLERIAATKGDDFYHGEIAGRIAAFARICGATMTEADLAAHVADWVDPIGVPFRDAVLHEIPPNGQGIAALMALGMLDALGVQPAGADDPATLHLQIEALKLAMADLYRHVADPAHMRVPAEALIDRDYLARRAALIDPRRAGRPAPGAPTPSSTVYLCAADASGMMVSFIQSNYMGFGSGVVIPGTGIALNNRGAFFTLEAGHPNEVAGGKRPLNTIIPGFLTRGGQPFAAFGVMGGTMQAQGHLQMAARMIDHGQGPQTAIDAPRWRVTDDNLSVMVEHEMPDAIAAGLSDRGHPVTRTPLGSTEFGAAQIIMRLDDGYAGGSESRRDGQVAAF